MIFKFSNEAQRDLNNIISYGITHYGDKVAGDYIDLILSTLNLITDNPLMGVNIELRDTSMRRMPIRSHMVYYQPLKTHILIVRILHASVDAPAQFDTQNFY